MKSISKIFRWLQHFVYRQKSNEHSIEKIDHEGRPNTYDPQRFDPDLAISPTYKIDKLGFGIVAKKLAASLHNQTTNQGLVISIEGDWGSGKSSLVNFLAEEIKLNSETNAELVRFEPWIVGDRDGMLSELISELAAAVERIQRVEQDQRARLRHDAQELAQKIRKYGTKLSRQTAPLARLAGLVGVPGGEIAAKILETSTANGESLRDSNLLPNLKQELNDGLSELNHKIIVIIDDLDRLEPNEAVEIMRLIKAVADFPNVIYLLCFEPKMLAASIKDKLSINDGSAFLEKIVQVRFNVPHPEAFDLRRWFFEEVSQVYDTFSARPLTDDERQRLQTVCSVEGMLLKTPRQLVRILNAVKLYWPPIQDAVDFSDVVWLQMVRIQNEGLYSWIEKYLVESAAIYDGASISENEKIEFAKSLEQHTDEGRSMSPRSMWTLKNYLPGITDNITDREKRVFILNNPKEFGPFINARRLGSPQHSRYYFSFAGPAGGLDDTRLASFLAKANSGNDLEETAKVLIAEKRPQGGSMFELLVDRLSQLDESKLTAPSASPILMMFANLMDEVGDKNGDEIRWFWQSADGLVKKLLSKMVQKDRSILVHQIFQSGRAISWLMNGIIRNEIFAHGRYGNNREPTNQWILSDDELDDAIEILLKRFKSSDADRIADSPELLSLMFGWMQAGDKSGVQAWVKKQISTDAGLLQLLSGCRGWLVSDRTYYPLKRSELENFLDFDEAIGRLKKISEASDSSDYNQRTALDLLEAAKVKSRD